MLSDPACWHHVQGHLNPADLPSRGCEVKQLLSSRWWERPAWLYDVLEKWPTDREWSCDEAEIDKELRKTATKKNFVCTLAALKSDVETENEFLDRFSNFKQMLRVLAYVL